MASIAIAALLHTTTTLVFFQTLIVYASLISLDNSAPAVFPNYGNALERISFFSSLDEDDTNTITSSSSIPVASGQHLLGVGNFVVRVKIGNPPQLAFMVLDTSSDGAWVPCTGCYGCNSTLFAPGKSQTYGSYGCANPECARVSGLPCSSTRPGSSRDKCTYKRIYGGDAAFAATLSRDSLRLGNVTLLNYTFGCVFFAKGRDFPGQGLLGLGRGNFSLLNQSGSLLSGVFSYCLPSYNSYYFSGSLKLGPAGQPNITKTTPLLQNPRRPSLYYVNLTAVSVGRVNICLPQNVPQFDNTTGAGTIIDSGTVISRFVTPFYNQIRDEFKKQVNRTFSSWDLFDTCFETTAEAAPPPRITFHFEEMDVVLPVENTLIQAGQGNKLTCLAMAASPNSTVNSNLNIIANLQQQNLMVLIDTAKSRVGIQRHHCT